MTDRTGWRHHWQQRRLARAELVGAGKVAIYQVQGRVQVTSPANPKFVAGAKELGGRWKARSGVWTFPLASQRLVVELAVKVFGVDKVKAYL